MVNRFRKALDRAEGRSEFIIVAVADIRGFSAFSSRRESPDTAMYIKRIYIKMIDNYFHTANFYKPTGDGLLLTFPYSEKNLNEVASVVIESCMRCLLEFSNLCAEDPMINFSVPQNIGFGIARGTACCLFSGNEILDYSGHLLNLTSRLTDLARPSGIVIDGNFLSDTIPESYREKFSEKEVYIRSLAEEKPIKVFYLRDYVEILETNLAPLKGDMWHTIQRKFIVRELTKLSNLRLRLPIAAKSQSKIKVQLVSPLMKDGKQIKGYSQWRDFSDFKYSSETGEPIVVLNISKAREYLSEEKVPKTRGVTFKIQYVPERPFPSLSDILATAPLPGQGRGFLGQALNAKKTPLK